MSLKLPLYLIAGEKPMSLFTTPDGGMDMRGWDFKLGKMTRQAFEWDPTHPDTREVTKKEFDAALRQLQEGT
jgi:hypothetical protein